MQDAEVGNPAVSIDLCDPPINLEGINLAKIGDLDLDGTINETLERLYPVEIVHGGSDAYDPVVHAQICRFAVLGLSTTTIAKAVGIAPATLSRWLQKFPKLASDMYRAQSAAVTDAVVRLRRIMCGDDPTAFNAIKFFLQARSPDFTERKQVEVSTVDDRRLIEDIRRDIYGIREDAPAGPQLPLPPAAPAPGKDSENATPSDLPSLRL